MSLITSKKTDHTVTKTLDGDISSARRMKVEFEWQNNASSGKGNGSCFAFRDSNDNMIFALYGTENIFQ